MTHHHSELAVEATGLIKTFGTTRVVDRFDLRVPRGQVVAVVGAAGAGKTTLLKMLATLLPIDGGSARVLGIDVASRPRDVRQLVGVTGQYTAIDDHLTGRENLILFGRLLGLRDRAIDTADELLARFGVAEVANTLAHELSTGARRRLDLAASLIDRPPVILLDEPTIGLDSATRVQVRDTLRELARDGMTVLMTTQYFIEAVQLADQIVMIDRGSKVDESARAAA